MRRHIIKQREGQRAGVCGLNNRRAPRRSPGALLLLGAALSACSAEPVDSESAPPPAMMMPEDPMQMPQMPQLPQMPQGPRWDMVPPPQKAGGNMYPTHPFVRSPRDFFMWGEMMEEERSRGNRPFPVPQ